MKNIVLCCAAGMSTSMLVQRMQDAAQKKGVEVSIKAVPVAEFKDNLAAADIILLGPQVKYEQAKLQALAEQTEDAALQAQFAPLAKSLAENEEKIVAEMKEVQGKPVDIGGYYLLDAEKVKAVMRPSATFNAALSAVQG